MPGLHMWIGPRNPKNRPGGALHILLSRATALGALAAFLLATQPARSQAGFVPGFEDLPLMFELDADDQPMVFDTPSGRIVEAVARGASSSGRVRAFYNETLRQLGWRSAGSTIGGTGTFVREGEQLRLSVTEPRSGEVEVRFSLAPAPR